MSLFFTTRRHSATDATPASDARATRSGPAGHWVGLEPLEPRLLLSVSTGLEQSISLFDDAPALFVENRGQWANESVQYLYQGSGANVLHTDGGPIFELLRQTDGENGGAVESKRFAVNFDGAQQVDPVGYDQAATSFNYFTGDPDSWQANVPGFETVAYEDLYEGIDLLTWAQPDHLKYEFRLDAGADPDKIQLSYEGIDGLSLADDGSMRIDVGDGWASLSDPAPYIYQDIDGQRTEVAGAFELIDDNTYSFDITGEYDPDHALVIDPAVSWSTYLGGSDTDRGLSVAADSGDNLLVVGDSFSSGWISGGEDTTYNGNRDAFVAKFDSDGNHLWSSYLGGSESDSGAGVAVDSNDNVLATGGTESDGWVSGGGDTTYGGNGDAFVAKLDSSGNLTWSTYLGGDAFDTPGDVTVDGSNNVLVAGDTESDGWVSGGYDTTYGGFRDGFVAKLDSSGSHTWSTYLGDDQFDNADGIAVDSNDNVVVTGQTLSDGWISGGYDTTRGGKGDGFAIKLNSSGSHTWSTYLGGGESDYGDGITVDSNDDVIVTGGTSSDGWVSGGHDTAYNGTGDAFLAKLNSNGSHAWSTYLGGDSADAGHGVATDSENNILVTGETESDGWTSGGHDTTYNGNKDAFVAKFEADGTHDWSTYLGGTQSDVGQGIAVNSQDHIVVAGETSSSGWTSGGEDTTYNGNRDAFLLTLTNDDNLPGPGGNLVDINGDGNVDLLWRNYSTGNNTIWTMNGTSKTGNLGLENVTNTDWRLEAAADFNGDGNADLLWRNYSTGSNIIWTMNGASKNGTLGVENVTDTNWHVEAVADFNGDGNVDLLWRNYSTGTNLIWTMNGASKSGNLSVENVTDTNWHVEGIGDFNSDGQTDLLWRNHSTGTNVLWTMNGNSKSGSQTLESVGNTDWHIVGTSDFNGDDNVDLLWRNYDTGNNLVWAMNGTSKSSTLSFENVTNTNWLPAGAYVPNQGGGDAVYPESYVAEDSDSDTDDADSVGAHSIEASTTLYAAEFTYHTTQPGGTSALTWQSSELTEADQSDDDASLADLDGLDEVNA